MNVRKYLAPPKDGILVGPHTSMCTNPNSLLALEAPEIGKGYLCCLPNTQPSKKFKFSWDLKISLSTKNICASNFKFSTPKCPSHWCHRSMLPPPWASALGYFPLHGCGRLQLEQLPYKSILE